MNSIDGKEKPTVVLPYPVEFLAPGCLVMALFIVVPAFLFRSGWGWLAIPVWLVFSPLLAALVDILQTRRRPTPRNLLSGCLLYAFRLAYLLLAQFAYVPVVFLVFPVGALSLVTTIAHVWFVTLGNSVDPSQLPLTCAALRLGPDGCTPALLVIHPIQIILAYLIVKYIDRYFAASKKYYDKGVEALQRLQDSLY